MFSEKFKLNMQWIGVAVFFLLVAPLFVILSYMLVGRSFEILNALSIEAPLWFYWHSVVISNFFLAFFFTGLLLYCRKSEFREASLLLYFFILYFFCSGSIRYLMS